MNSTHVKELFDPRPAKEALKTFDDLMEAIRTSEHGYDIPLIERAYQLAAEQHKDQMRLSGSPYISHQLAVA